MYVHVCVASFIIAFFVSLLLSLSLPSPHPRPPFFLTFFIITDVESRRNSDREMAGNEWLNGYLEAILDAGSGRNSDGSREEEKIKNNKSTSPSLRKRFDEKLTFEKFEARKEKEAGKLFSPTKYFVEEVVNSFDESDLYRTWIKVSLSLSLFFFLYHSRPYQPTTHTHTHTQKERN